MKKKCGCKEKKCNCKIEQLCSELGCEFQLSTDCVFYNLHSCSLSLLYNLSLLNGVDLTSILNKIDEKLNSVTGYNFNGFSLSCLNNGFTINTIKDFAEKISLEFCSLKIRFNNLEENFNILTNSFIDKINDLDYLNLNLYCTNIVLGDNLKNILQKILSYICTLNLCDSNNNNNQLLIYFNLSSSIGFINTNNTYTFNTKISLDINNCLEIRLNGLYILCLTILNNNQSLSINGNNLSISSGNTISLLSGIQTLSIDCNTKILSLSNSNQVNLSCLILSNTDEKVKTSSLDLSSGYLNDKIIGIDSGDIEIIKTLNLSTNKIELSANIDYSVLVSNIINNLTLLSLLCNSLKLCLTCYKYRIENTSVTNQTYSYTQCDNITNSNITIGLSSIVEVCGLSVNVSDLSVLINIVGNC